MEQYPSIVGSAKAPLSKTCIAFNKYDGSNLRWEWTPKKGWAKFGTRKHLFDHTDTQFKEAIPLFLDSGMGEDIVRRTKDYTKNPQRITAFTEFFGPGSFAGNHVEGESKELRLFDVFLFKKGFVRPRDFINVYGSMAQAAEIIYEGNLNKQFIADVKTGKYPVFEGVIAKGDDFMVKIKTDEYFRRLRDKYPERWQDFGE